MCINIYYLIDLLKYAWIEAIIANINLGIFIIIRRFILHIRTIIHGFILHIYIYIQSS